MELQIKIKPMGKPRMTQRDKWAKRPCVTKYWEYKDELNKAVSARPDIARALRLGNVYGISWVAKIQMPKSWNKLKKSKMRRSYHCQKPDRDNIDKGILDALMKEDSGVAYGTLLKIWVEEESSLDLTFHVL